MTVKKEFLLSATVIMAEDLKMLFKSKLGACDSRCIVNRKDCVQHPQFNCSGVIRAAYIKKAETTEEN